MQKLSFKRQFFYVFGVYMTMLIVLASLSTALLPTKNMPAQSCPYDVNRLKFVGEWSPNNILITTNNDKYLSKLIFFQANNNLTAINKSISLANKNLDIIGALALTGNLCLRGVCRSGLNEVRGLIGEGVTGSVAFWVANDEIRGDLNFVWQTSTRNLIITNIVTSSQLKGSLRADYVKSGLFLNNLFAFPQNLTVGNNLYLSNAIFTKATMTTNRAFCLGTNCLSFWPWLTENFVRGSGTINYIAKWISADTIGKSIIYEDNNKIGINTTSLFGTVNIAGSLFVRCLASVTTTCFTLTTATQDKFVLTSDSFGNAYWSQFRSIPQNSFILSFYDDLNNRYPAWQYANAYILLKNQGTWLIPSVYDFSKPYDPNEPADKVITLRQERANHSAVLYNDESANIKRIYVFGGNKNITSGNDNLNTIEYLDLNSTTYDFVLETATLPERISDAASVFDPIRKKIYIIGGSKNDDVDASSVLDLVIECSLDSNKKIQCSKSDTLKLPTKRANHRAILYKDKIIVIGGKGRPSNSQSNFGYLNHIEYFDLSNPSQGWRTSSVTLNQVRSNFAAVLFYNESLREDNIYIIGGNKDNACFNSVEKITLSSSTQPGDPLVSISAAPNFVFRINQHDAVVFQKRIFVIGGLKKCEPTLRLNEVYYGDGLNPWQSFSSPLKYSIARHSVVSFFYRKPFMVLIGGRDERNKATTSIQVFNSSYPSFLIGDSSYDLPEKLRASASVIDQDKIFVIGGDDNSAYASKNVHILNLSSTSTVNKWFTGPSIINRRSSAQAVIAQGYGSNNNDYYIYLIGGNSGELGDLNNSLDSVEVFNLSKYLSSNVGSWFDAVSTFKLPTKRTQHGAVVINNKIFVIGGITPKGTTFEATSSILMLNPTSTFLGGNKWQYVGNLPQPRNRFAVVPWYLGTSTGFYVIGGGTANNINSAVDSIIKCNVSFNPTSSVACSSDKRMRLKRIDVSANLVGNEVIIFGGTDGSRVFDSVEKFKLDSLATNTLYLPSVLNFERRAHISQVYNRKIYVIGGNRTVSAYYFLTTTEIFSNPIYYLYYYLYGR